MKIWILNNTKFGYKSNSKMWSNNMFEYFDREFLPLLKKQYKEDDIIVHLGNVFNGSETINTKILNSTIDLFEKISNIGKTYLLVGNNDRSGDNKINTLKYFEHFSNMTVVTDYKKIPYKDITIKLLSWNNNINLLDGDINLTNTELLKYDSSLIKNKTYCGFYDDSSTKGNVTCIGSPYQLENTSNEKGFYIVDVDRDKDIFLKNKTSPIFDNIEINEMSQLEELDIVYIEKNFVNISINQKLVEEKKIKVDILLSKFNFKKISYFGDVEEIETLKDETIHIDEMILNKIKESDNDNLMKEFEDVIKVYKDKY